MTEKPLGKTMVPGSTLIMLQKQKIHCCNFTLQSIYLSLSDLILTINKCKGIDNHLARVGCKCLLLCVHVLFTRHLCGSPIGSTTLVLTTGNAICYYIASPFLFEENADAAHK